MKKVINVEPGEVFKIIELKTVDAMIQVAYKAGKEGRPLMVALNEEVKG